MKPGRDHLPAGRDLDELIAEKVMGWIPGPCTGHTIELPGGWGCDECTAEGQWGFQGHHTKLPRQYSTDIAAAWEVVEKLQKEWIVIINGYQDKWDVEVNMSGKYVSEVYESALTAPHAICLAALEAVSYPTSR
jgi:hypothetical protein